MAATNEVVVITGASAGVGRATAWEFAKRGARVALLSRNAERLEAVRREVHERGGTALAIPVDVADAKAVEDAAERVEKELGPIDIWVNNAMLSVFSPAMQMSPDEFRRVTDVTYLGTVHGTLAALRRMIPRDRGAVVQVGSALAYRGIPLQSAYCGSKHAVQGFMDSLRSELLHEKSRVRVCMVQLPAVNTPQFAWVKSRLPNQPQPVPPIFQPEVAARAIYWAAHHKRRELYVGLPSLITIVGDKIAAGLGDRYLAWMGYKSQQTDEPVDPDRKDNLWESVAGPFGAHGAFDARATARSAHLWLTIHRERLFVAAGLAALAFLVFRPKRRAPRFWRRPFR